ncbi:polymer-forming cytoskeletal protein [uncultured Psychroserpens sp.]|uniref:polymer-forming cytoskeletal protein n=1 Tax=uncultured Psychroserpens sp. TaxID=255436 RepID=UPI00260C25C0|nr:polymer-forming cytoskeletal protein [uncultured Psychroserpens sp.]
MKKIKAGALQMVTFIIVVIALFLSAILILMHVHKQFRQQTNHTIEVVKLADKGIKYQLSQKSKAKDTITIPLFDEDYKSLKVKSNFWGIYEKVYAEAQIKNKQLSKIALVGEQTSMTKTALVVKDNQTPLVVVGNTKIEGMAHLPERGVKTGNIAGQSYYGTKPIYGLTKTTKEFPELHANLQAHLRSMITQSVFNKNDVQYVDLNAKKKLTNSFNKVPMLVFSNYDIWLSDIELSGHIIIQSHTKIIVDDTSQLKDVMLIAPIIEIRSHTKGTFQAFATERITVYEGVQLKYPSALVLYGDYEKGKERLMELRPTSQIKGSVLCLGHTQADNYDIQLKVANDVTIEGEIYCEQNLELRGTVNGSVYTNNFIVKEGGTTYQNHMYNAKITIKAITEQYVGLAFDQSPKQVIKWLY